MTYKYKVFLKSGASFDVQSSNYLYEGFTDTLNETLDDNSLIPIYFNESHVASVVRNEVAAFILLGQENTEHKEVDCNDERDRFLLTPVIDLSGMRLNHELWLDSISGRALNRIEAISDANGGNITLSNLLEFRKNDLLQIDFCGKKTINEIADFLHWLTEKTGFKFKLRDNRENISQFASFILEKMAK